jgi:N-acetyl-anhydromuramyl-L-alanine amidase AmpD
MKIVNIVKQLPFTGSNGTMDLSKISIAVIHHDGTVRPDKYNSIKRYIEEANYHISKGWNHISYHYSIDNTGTIYQCLPENEIGYHCGNLTINKKSIAIKFDGNMETQKLTTAQIRAYRDLMKYLTTKRPDLPKIIKGSERPHRSVKPTSCPGKNVTETIIHKF